MLIKDPPVAVADGLLMLGTNEYPAFFVQDQGQGAIFEGGVSAIGPVVKGQLSQLGVTDDSVQQIIITHAHPDHVMAVPGYRALFPDVTVSASRAAAGTLAVEKAVKFFGKIDGMLTQALVKAGSIPEAPSAPALTENKIPVDRILAEGDEVTIGARKFAVLATPGHSDCSLSFHEGSTGVLIISDATGYYIPESDTCWPNYFARYGDYLQSMQRLAKLEAQVLCLSHNAVINGSDAIKDYFAQAISVTEAYHERIVNEVKAGQSPEEIAAQLGTEVYEKTQLLDVDFFKKNCALLVNQSMKYAGLDSK
jgi:glyoxylase-like metal-dependent hydrolase (beta-lactamase superfamily II)